MALTDRQKAYSRMRKLLRVFRGFLFFALAFLFLWEVAHFSLMQAVAILIMLVSLNIWHGSWHEQSWQGKQYRLEQFFRPYTVRLELKFIGLLVDYRIVRIDPEEPRQPHPLLSFPPEIVFTVLQPGHAVEFPGLVYHDTRKCLLTRIDFEEPVGEMISRLLRKFQSPGFAESSASNELLLWPDVFLRVNAKGYEIGITVPSRYWERLCETGEAGDLVKTQAHTDSYTGTTRLIVATLPYSAFGVYYQNLNPHEWLKLREEQLAECGRKDAERRGPWSRLEHKYFVVEHRAV
jgi:hypothetical protein